MTRTDAPGVVVVRGAGDIATGAIQKLAHAGFKVLALEVASPMAIRWKAALCAAVEHGEWPVEDLVGVRVDSLAEAENVWASVGARTKARIDPAQGTTGVLENRPYRVPVLVDPDASILTRITPWAVVDAVLAKRNVGTTIDMAPVVVALGPGFEAGTDCHFVIETMRGHDLGRVIADGPALPNTGIPGLIAGRAAERVVHSPASGRVRVIKGIGDIVDADEPVCVIEPSVESAALDAEYRRRLSTHQPDPAAPPASTQARASIAGVIRGMIPDGALVHRGMKIADVDPRTELASAVDTISDKSRAVGGGTLDAILQGLRAAHLWAPTIR